MQNLSRRWLEPNANVIYLFLAIDDWRDLPIMDSFELLKACGASQSLINLVATKRVVEKHALEASPCCVETVS